MSEALAEAMSRATTASSAVVLAPTLRLYWESELNIVRHVRFRAVSVLACGGDKADEESDGGRSRH